MITLDKWINVSCGKRNSLLYLEKGCPTSSEHPSYDFEGISFS